MATKTIVIRANNTEAIAFLEEVSRKKAETLAQIKQKQTQKFAHLFNSKESK